MKMGNLRCVLILCIVTYATCDIPADPPSSVNVPVCAALHNIDRWSTSTCDCDGNEWYIIQSTTGGLVLDASEPHQIRLQHFTGYAQQLWKFERAGKPGVYYIISNYTGTALDVDKDGKPLKSLILKQKSGSLTQKWVTSPNGRLRNVGTELLLDVVGGKFEPGTLLNVWPDNGHKAQEFTLQQKNE